jgi:hypothetical protein
VGRRWARFTQAGCDQLGFERVPEILNPIKPIKIISAADGSGMMEICVNVRSV